MNDQHYWSYYFVFNWRNRHRNCLLHVIYQIHSRYLMHRTLAMGHVFKIRKFTYDHILVKSSLHYPINYNNIMLAVKGKTRKIRLTDNRASALKYSGHRCMPKRRKLSVSEVWRHSLSDVTRTTVLNLRNRFQTTRTVRHWARTGRPTERYDRSNESSYDVSSCC